MKGQVNSTLSSITVHSEDTCNQSQPSQAQHKRAADLTGMRCHPSFMCNGTLAPLALMQYIQQTTLYDALLNLALQWSLLLKIRLCLKWARLRLYCFVFFNADELYNLTRRLFFFSNYMPDPHARIGFPCRVFSVSYFETLPLWLFLSLGFCFNHLCFVWNEALKCLTCAARIPNILKWLIFAHCCSLAVLMYRKKGSGKETHICCSQL